MVSVFSFPFSFLLLLFFTNAFVCLFVFLFLFFCITIFLEQEVSVKHYNYFGYTIHPDDNILHILGICVNIGFCVCMVLVQVSTLHVVLQ